MSTSHLWQADHDYHCHEGSAFYTFDSWDEFLLEMEDADPKFNLLFRWDWRLPATLDEHEEHVLFLFYVMQGKGSVFSCEVTVSTEDEPEVKAWLRDRWAYLRRLWDPVRSER